MRPSPQCGRDAETVRLRAIFLRCLTPANRRPQASMGESDYEEADDDFDDEGAAVRIP